jgi:hypothetical protein
MVVSMIENDRQAQEPLDIHGYTGAYKIALLREIPPPIFLTRDRRANILLPRTGNTKMQIIEVVQIH